MPSFYVRNPRDSLLADKGSAGLRSHEKLSDKETVKTGRNSCDLYILGLTARVHVLALAVAGGQWPVCPWGQALQCQVSSVRSPVAGVTAWRMKYYSKTNSVSELSILAR